MSKRITIGQTVQVKDSAKSLYAGECGKLVGVNYDQDKPLIVEIDGVRLRYSANELHY